MMLSKFLKIWMNLVPLCCLTNGGLLNMGLRWDVQIVWFCFWRVHVVRSTAQTAPLVVVLSIFRWISSIYLSTAFIHRAINFNKSYSTLPGNGIRGWCHISCQPGGFSVWYSYWGCAWRTCIVLQQIMYLWSSCCWSGCKWHRLGITWVDLELCEQSTKDGTSDIVLFAQTSKSISYRNYEKNKNKIIKWLHFQLLQPSKRQLTVICMQHK